MQNQKSDFNPDRREGLFVLSSLEDKDWRVLLRYAIHRTFAPAEVLIQMGDADDSVYILLEGKVEVIRPGWLWGARRIAIITKGSVFGEMAFFESKPRSATVRAVTKGSILLLTRKSFNKLSQDEPSLGHRLLFEFGKILSLRNRNVRPLVLR